MTKNRIFLLSIVFLFLILASCRSDKKYSTGEFDALKRTLEIGSWQFSLNIENQNKTKGNSHASSGMYYLKATLYISNIKTKKSLLYAISKNIEDYEAKYKYLSFHGQDDLYIKWNDIHIYPIGYVFEPSNGLARSEKLVYKFQVGEDDYNRMIQDSKNVEYWYTDRMIGLGKICFKSQQ